MSKQVTKGWMTVLLLFSTMNAYLLFRYFQIDFSNYVYLKQSIYIIIHSLMLVNAILYFYRFYTGKKQQAYAKVQAILAGFYLVFLHASFALRLIYDFLFKNIFKTEILPIDLWIFILSFFIAASAYLNAKEFKMSPYRVRIDAKGKEAKDLKIVYLSDLHFGVSWDLKRLETFIASINRLELDAVFLGGDIFDEGSKEEDKEMVAKLLKQINSRLGTYYIEGNHEYIDIEGNIQHFRRAGIHVLEDEAILLDASFYLIGRRDDEGQRSSLSSILDHLPKDYPMLLLDHRPHHQEALDSKEIDLQISGHTHAGQFVPFRLLNPLMKKISSYVYGHYKQDDFHLIVSSGLGNWAVPYRLFSKAEFVYLELQLR